MDLNEKLAARRKELAAAKEQERITQEEFNRQATENAKKQQQEAIISEVSRRAEQGIDLPGETTARDGMTNAAFEKALNKAASGRMTPGESGVAALLVIIGVGGFFYAWWFGLGFVFWGGHYLNKKTDYYKRQIVAEGEVQNNSTVVLGESEG